MIAVTRLDGSRLVINAELIEALEATPDTVITLTTGRRVVVREPVEEVVQRVIDYRRQLLEARRRPAGAQSGAGSPVIGQPPAGPASPSVGGAGPGAVATDRPGTQ